METQPWSNFVSYLINKNSDELACSFRDFVATRDVLKILKLHSPTTRAIFEKFQNITRGHK